MWKLDVMHFPLFIMMDSLRNIRVHSVVIIKGLFMILIHWIGDTLCVCAGVLETGLFLNMAKSAYFGKPDGTHYVQHSPKRETNFRL